MLKGLLILQYIIMYGTDFTQKLETLNLSGQANSLDAYLQVMFFLKLRNMLCTDYRLYPET